LDDPNALVEEQLREQREARQQQIVERRNDEAIAQGMDSNPHDYLPTIDEMPPLTVGDVLKRHEEETRRLGVTLDELADNGLPFVPDPQHYGTRPPQCNCGRGGPADDCPDCRPDNCSECECLPSLGDVVLELSGSSDGPCGGPAATHFVTIEQIIMEEDAELYAAFKRKYPDWEWIKVTRESLATRGELALNVLPIRVWIKHHGAPVFIVSGRTTDALLAHAAN
jgi:hypothetical protein